MEFIIEGIPIELTTNPHGVTLKTLDTTLPLPGQTIAEAQNIIQSNFKYVCQYYLQKPLKLVEINDVHVISLLLVVFYFEMYNSWKYSNEKHTGRDLQFLEKDFDHPYTWDRIIQYFKNKDETKYIQNSAELIGIPEDQLQTYEYKRKEFYDFFR